SLENIIDFSSFIPLTADQRSQAHDRFYAVINHFSAPNTKEGYSRPLLVWYMLEYARSELSQDIILRVFFEFLNLGLTSDDDDIDFDDQLGIGLTTFADFLIDNFFLLRGICLVRDRNRCVISRIFDQCEALSRLKRLGNNARDDDGKLLFGEVFTHLVRGGTHSSTCPDSGKCRFSVGKPPCHQDQKK
ncbi:hypothetical protein LOZ07_005669, partial [Ophidiomyces ophidiicola]